MRKLSLFPILGLGLVTCVAVGITSKSDISKDYVALKKDKMAKEAKEKEEVKGAMLYNQAIRANQITGTVDITDVEAARMQAQVLFEKSKKKQRAFDQMIWEERGPSDVGGRTRALLVDKNNSNKLFIAGISGGLFMSTDNGDNWTKVKGTDTTSAVSIASICQTANGDIYYGTGEGFYIGPGVGAQGQLGDGIWKSTDGGTTFNRLPSTATTNSNTTSDAWAFVDKLVAHPTDPNKIFAATNGGFKISSDGGATWVKPATLNLSARINDVDVSSDGMNVIVSTSTNLYVSNDGGATFSTNKLNNSAGLPNATGVGRVEVAIAPSNPAYMYVVTSKSEKLGGVYKSTDAGATWSTIGLGGNSTFNPLGEQGDYNIAFGVHPTNPDMVFLGGQFDLYRYTPAELWKPIAFWAQSSFSGKFVHADMHGIVFNPSNAENMYVITDGGFFRTFNCSAPDPFFGEKNKNYITAQCYGIGANALGHVVFGTQDNGSGVVGTQGNSPLESKDATGGDGTRCALSDFNPSLIFTSVINGELRRATDGGVSMASFKSIFDKNVDSLVNETPADHTPDGAPDGGALWVAPLLFEENFVNGKEKSVMLLGTNSYIAFTPNALEPKVTWFRIAAGSFGYSALCLTKDGKHIYAGDQNGNVYRIDVPDLWNSKFYYQDSINKNTGPYEIWDGTSTLPSSSIVRTTIYTNPGRFITDISCDNSGNNVVVTMGNYGNTNYVVKSLDGLAATPSFNPINGALPKMPVYSVIHVGGSATKLIIATEMGLYGSSNGGATWDDINMMDTDPSKWHPRVGTFEITQKSRLVTPTGTHVGPIIYSGTHGRGIFRSTSLATGFWATSVDEEVANIAKVNAYPNPTNGQLNIDLNGMALSNNSTLAIHSLTGSVVFRTMIQKGMDKTTLDVSKLPAGAYVISIQDGNKKIASSFIKQ